MRRILATLAGLLVFAFAQAQDFKKETVHFETDKAELRKTEKQRIDDFLTTLGNLDKVRFGVYGHTDSRGSIEYNLDLSDRRTESVMDYLMFKGVAANDIISDYFGEIKPVAENDNNNGMANNRRVEIRAFIIPQEEMISQAPTKDNPYGFKEHKLVKPILPKLAKEREVFTVDANQPIVLKIASGTRVRIPANSLVDARGNVIQGKVNISYREYHEPMDVLLSGIPMTFDSAGTGHQFQTAGMFELQAVKNGREIFMKEGESIKVDLQSMDNESDYNLYALDESQGWQNINTAPANPPIPWTGNNYPSKAYEYYMNFSNVGHAYLEKIDQCQFNELFDDEAYYYTHKMDEVSDFKATYLFASGRRKSRVGRYGLLKVRTVRRERGDPKGLVRFTIQQLTTRYTHPELKSFRDQVWILEESMDRVAFRRAFSYKKRYNDVRVNISDNGDYVVLNLKGDDGYTQFKVKPWIAGIEDPDRLMESFQDQYERYEKQLAKREKKYNRYRNRQNKEWLEEYEKSRTAFNKQVEKLKTDKEKAMSYNEWIAYNEDLMEQYRQNADLVAASSFTLTRSLSLEGFGIYNCDQIYRLKQPVNVVAKYQVPDEKKPVQWDIAYVIDANLRGVLTYYKGGYASTPAGMVTLDPKTVQAMVVVDDEGKLSYIKKDDLDYAFEDGKAYNFPVTQVDEVTSVGQLKELLGLAN